MTRPTPEPHISEYVHPAEYMRRLGRCKKYGVPMSYPSAYPLDAALREMADEAERRAKEAS